MANTCLVTKLQGTVSGDNLIKFGTLKLLISRKYLTLSDNYVKLLVKYTGLTNSDTPTAKFSFATKFNNVDYAANAEIALTPVTSVGVYNEVNFKISDIPADGAYAYISDKYNIHSLGGQGTNITCIMSPMELSYLSSFVNSQAMALEGGSISELDCPNMEVTPFIKGNVGGDLSDYPSPAKLKTIRANLNSTFAVVKNDLMDFENLTTFYGYSNPNVEMNTSDMVSLLSTLTKLNTMDVRASGVSCDADSLALGLKTAGVVSRTIQITMYASQWGGSGTASTKKTFTFDAQGDYVIS